MTEKEINKLGADHLKKRMELHKLNQTEVDKLTGIPQNRISRIIRNKNRISLPDFVKMCELLNADFSDYFYEVTGGHNHNKDDQPIDIMSISNSQKSIISDTFNAKSPVAQMMLRYNEYASLLSHPFSPPPSYLQDVPQDDSIPACNRTALYSWLCQLDGVGGTPSIFADINSVERNFQLECRMD